MKVPGRAAMSFTMIVVALASCAPGANESSTSVSPMDGNVSSSSAHPRETNDRSDDYVSIAGTHISLRRPAGLKPDPMLPGLARAGSRTSIIVLDEGRAPSRGTPQEVLTELETSFRDQGRAARTGLKLAEPRSQQIAGYPGVVVTGTQTQGGQPYDKALVAVATEDSTVLMTATIERGDAMSADEALDILTQARWNVERAPHDFGFSLTAAPGFEKVPSSALMYSLSGADQVRFTASPSSETAPTPVERRRLTAEQRFRQLPGSPEPNESTETDIAGLPCWEITGHSPLTTFYAAMVFVPDGYVLLTGSQPKAQADLIPAFRLMAHSLQFEK